jgi:hypothetical protein
MSERKLQLCFHEAIARHNIIQQAGHACLFYTLKDKAIMAAKQVTPLVVR